MSRLLDYVSEAVRSPREKLSGGQHFLRQSWELTVYCGRQLQRHRAEGMAAELTYRTIFALIPVVVLGLVMFRIVGGLDDVQDKVENQLYSFFGVPEISVTYAGEDDVLVQDMAGADDDSAEEPAVVDGATTPADAAGETEEITAAEPNPPPTADVDEATRREARASIRRTLRAVTAKVASVDFKSIGVFGLLLFVYAAVALADSTEHLFNRIYEAPSQRPIHIRVAIHWSIITLGSGLLAMSLYLSSQFVDWFASVVDASFIEIVLRHLLSITASWVLFFLLYALMPNTHVSVPSAAIGSLVASLLWEAAKFGFQIYVTKAVPYSAIYGSIGLIPLFLFWIYVTWLIVLFGLILTYTLQSMRGGSLNRFETRESNLPTGDPDWMLPIMCEVGHAFVDGEVIDFQELADRLGLSSRIVHELTGKLIEVGLLRRVTIGAGEEESLTLARPAEKICIGEILDLAHRVRPTSDHPAWRALANLKQAERDAAAGQTLADLQLR